MEKMEACLPQAFKEKMQRLLGEEYEEFIEGYDRERAQSLRVNPLKITCEEFLKLSPFSLRQVPWAREGFYYGKEDRPGKHPYHEAGLYYIQEASAMAVGELAEAKPGERVLDLCAAPGGKTTHLAAAMKGKGLLVSNEIHPTRAKILASNVERMGISNAVVTNETPENLAVFFPEFFDRIVVDAPCSGEGMFRKEDQALEHWSLENVALCASRQQEILDEAAKMLRPGGTLIYSTCTFAPEENEGSIAAFVKKHPDFSVKKVSAHPLLSPGRPEWAENFPAAEDTFRLWPHRLEGEGHFAAVLEKCGASEPYEERFQLPKLDRNVQKLYAEFASQNLRKEREGMPLLFGDQLYLLPCALPLKGVKILRPGLHLGTVKKNRFEPAHAYALALKSEEVLRTCNLSVEDAKRYLHGESLEAEGEKGWTLTLVDGYSLGWGKVSGGVMKNHYPKGLRK